MNRHQEVRGVNIFDIIQPAEKKMEPKKIGFTDLVKNKTNKKDLVKYFKELARQLNKDQDYVSYKQDEEDE